jgi:hypothetical protein
MGVGGFDHHGETDQLPAWVVVVVVVVVVVGGRRMRSRGKRKGAGGGGGGGRARVAVPPLPEGTARIRSDNQIYLVAVTSLRGGRCGRGGHSSRIESHHARCQHVHGRVWLIAVQLQRIPVRRGCEEGETEA